jgi:hypothetical protein
LIQFDTDDPNAFNKNVSKRIAEELAEVDEPRNRAQAQIDRWWEATRGFEAEASDSYMVGGFMERWSQTPSYTKDRRDRDWRVR